MASRMLRGIGAGVFASGLTVALAGGGFAQQSTNRVAANTDWSVFVEADECWSVSSPKESLNTRDGKPVEVSRDETLLFVTYSSTGLKGEVSFTGGYPFADGSTVTLQVDDTKFDLITISDTEENRRYAWSASPEEDARILAAMKAGTKAVLIGRSGRGTLTTDTFSLLGFTASVTEAAKRCAG